MRWLAMMLALTSAGASRAGTPAWAPEPYPNGIGVSAGLHIFLLDDTPFGAMAQNYGLDILGSGPAFSLSYDRRVLSWLSLGGTLAFRYSEGRQSKLVAGIRGLDEGGPEAGLYIFTPRVFGRASFYTPDNGIDDAAVEMGIELSLGGGPTFFALRGEVDVAPHFEAGAALLWSLHIGCWAATLRIIHGLMWQEGLGPLDVGFAAAWMPTIDLRLEKRW